MKNVVSLTCYCLLTLFVGCNSPKPTESLKPAPELTPVADAAKKTVNQDGMIGTWVSVRPNSFQIVNIPDSSHATVSRYEEWLSADKISKRFYFTKTGTIDIKYKVNIVIITDRHKFYYFLQKDTLFEMGEPGRVDTLLKTPVDTTM